MRLSDEDIPEWVPPSVKSMALVMPVRMPPVREVMVLRLLTDVRMKAVWRYLLRRKIDPSALGRLPSLQRMIEWGLCEEGISLPDQACAALFSYVVTELGSPRPFRTRQAVERFTEPWRSAAKLCWWITRNDARPRIDTDFAHALSAVAEYMEQHVRTRELKDPYTLERSSKERGDDEIRAQVRALATAMRAIFGSYLYGTTAAIATIALQTEVSAKSAINWCADLPRE